MKIQIHTDDIRLTIRIPTYLALNALTASIAEHHLKKHNFPQLDKKTLTALFCEIRKLKKKYPEWQLVKIEAREGERIEVKM